MDYVSPGDAFSSSLEQSLLQRAQQARQAQQDQIALQREARMNRIQDEERQQAKDALAEKRAEFADTQKEKRKSSFEKSVSTMVPGDIPSPDMVAQAKEFGMGHLFPEALPTAPESMPGIAAVPLPQGPQPNGLPPMPDAAPEAGIAPTRTGEVVNPASQQGGFRFVGTPVQRKESDDDKAALAFAQTLPDGSPERQALEFFVKTGKTPPAGMFKTPAAGHTRLIFDPLKRTYTDASGAPVTDIPDGAVVDRAAEPRDTSASDARNDAHVQTTKEHAYTEFNNEAKPVEDQIRRIQKFTTNLNQGNNIADSTLAEQLVTLTAGGTGSGVRLSQPMLDQVFKSRTKYEDFEVALRKWSVADPKDKANTSLFFTDEQRQQMLGLARAYRQAANATLKKILDARTGIDAAKSVDEVNRLRTKAHSDIFAEPDEEGAGGAAKPAAAPKRIRYDINGKPVS